VGGRFQGQARGKGREGRAGRNCLCGHRLGNDRKEIAL